MGQLTKQGYEIKTQNEYFQELVKLHKDIDPDWNLDPSSPDGLKIAHDAEVFSALDEQIKEAYDARDPNKAQGYDLDTLRALTSSKRSLGTPSSVELSVSGVASTFIPKKSRVKTINGIVFETTEDVIIALDGTAKVKAQNIENGAVEVSANSLTTIVDTVGGWQKVTNATPATIGTDIDSDSVFRIKSAKSVGRESQNQVDSLYGVIFDTDGVRKVRIYENKQNTATVDPVKNPHGLPAHSLAIVVDGGIDDYVARSIFNRLSVGCTLYAVGTKVEKTVRSERYKTSSTEIIFSRPIDVNVNITVTIADPNNVLPTDNEIAELIKQAYIDFYEGDLLPSGIGFLTTGFDIGEDVPYTRLFTPANKVLGLYSGSYVSDLTVNGKKENVKVDFNKLARFTKANIEVIVQ